MPKTTFALGRFSNKKKSAEGKDNTFKIPVFLIKESISQRGDKISYCKSRAHHTQTSRWKICRYC